MHLLNITNRAQIHEFNKFVEEFNKLNRGNLYISSQFSNLVAN